MNMPEAIEVPETAPKPGPKPGKAAHQKAEADAMRLRIAETERMIALLTATFPGLLSGHGVESMAREIFIRAMVNTVGASDEDPATDARARDFYTGRAQAARNAALIAARTFYADPATE